MMSNKTIKEYVKKIVLEQMDSDNSAKLTQLTKKTLDGKAGDNLKKAVEESMTKMLEDSDPYDGFPSYDIDSFSDQVDDLTDLVYDDIMKLAPEGPLKEKLKNGELSDEEHEAVIEAMIEFADGWVDSLFDDVLDGFKDALEYQKDPYSYYGVNRSDFY